MPTALLDPCMWHQVYSKGIHVSVNKPLALFHKQSKQIRILPEVVTIECGISLLSFAHKHSLHQSWPFVICPKVVLVLCF